MNDIAQPPATRSILVRSDLIRFEHIITDTLERFFSFKAHSIYFPREGTAPDAPRRLTGEGKLLLPLRLKGETLGVFAGRGVRIPRNLFPILGQVADLCVENLALHKSNLTDSLTGLYTRDYLLQNMSQTIARQRADFLTSDSSGAVSGAALAPTSPPEIERLRHSNFAVLTVQLRGLQRIAADYGYLFLEQILTRLAAEFAELIPEQALAARISDGEFGLYLPQGTPKACRKLGGEIAARLSALTFSHELSGGRTSIRAAAGYACYPQQADMPILAHAASGADFSPDMDQARAILRKSRHAAYIVATEFDAPSYQQVLGFEGILTSGGRIRELLPYGRVRINLGSEAGAKVGQCFAIWGADPAKIGFDPLKADSTNLAVAAYRGELVLISVDKHEAGAELFFQTDPARPVQPGDYLTLLPEGVFQHLGQAQKADPASSDTDAATGCETGLVASADNIVVEKTAASREGTSSQPASPSFDFLDHQTFMDNLTLRQKAHNSCAVALLRLDILSWGQDHAQPLDLGQLTAKAAKICQEYLPQDSLAGLYGMHSFIFFHPDLDAAAALNIYRPLAQAISKTVGIDCACGISVHPYLDYHKSELIDNCRKALVYAMLLPELKVGVFNSLALNISADRLFSHGDYFEAIQEYKRALLADEDNAMAWISLGVCHAGIGRKNDARTCFERALKLNPTSPQDIMVLYNLGQIHQDLGETKAAAAYYNRCLRIDPGHAYATLRLGQLAEQAKHNLRARRYYEKALKLPGGESPAQRRLARLALRLNNLDEAREHLHQALLADPQDSMALSLLAGLYLDAGEDAGVALALARQSVSLRPDIRANWRELARALERAGQPEAACEARRKSEQL